MYKNKLQHKITVFILILIFAVCMSGCKDKKTDINESTSEVNSKTEYIESVSKNETPENIVTKIEKSEINTVSDIVTDIAVKSTTIPQDTTLKIVGTNVKQSDIETKPITSKQENTPTKKITTESATIVTAKPVTTTAIQTPERDENELPGVDPFA